MSNGWKKNAGSGLSRKEALGSSSWAYCRCGNCQRSSPDSLSKPWQKGYVQRQGYSWERWTRPQKRRKEKRKNVVVEA